VPDSRSWNIEFVAAYLSSPAELKVTPSRATRFARFFEHVRLRPFPYGGCGGFHALDGSQGRGGAERCAAYCSRPRRRRSCQSAGRRASLQVRLVPSAFVVLLPAWSND
jgi:hypothetical protein